MTTRILPKDQYGKLVGTELEGAIDLLPSDAEVLVVEDGAEVVGCWAAIPHLHVEGLWVHPDRRGKMGVTRRLWTAMMEWAALNGRQTVLTGCNSDVIARLLAHAGAVQLPGTTYAIRVERTDSCQPQSLSLH